jgi:hypothetical protein
VLTPFNPAFAAIGHRRDRPWRQYRAATRRAGADRRGTHAGSVNAAVGLIDTDFPNGNAGATATLFTQPRSASVLVSDDNVRWHSLGANTFDLPRISIPKA